MSLSNINVPGFVIAELYRNVLIEPEESFARAAVKATPQAKPKPQPVAKAPVTAEPQPVVKTPVIESVVEVATPKPPVAAPAPVTYKILGNNKKQITVVVNCPDDVFVPEAELQFLTKMLEACKLNMADVAIVNHAVAQVAIEPLKQQLQPEYVLLFGVEPGAIQLPISFPAFKEQPYAGSTYLFTPLLNQLNQENDEAKQQKRKLWDCLKRMFL